MNPRSLAKAELLTIILLACVPLFVTFPYRVNIFLSWEGAYRISQGQIPFKDFGTPLGGVYWFVPAIFFKLFGPKLITLVKAQVFINVIAALSFRSILSSLEVKPGIRYTSILLFCVSYSFINFWPWYNHTVIVYELAAIAMLLKYICGSKARFGLLWLIASAFFVCLSLLTKQDGGAMAFLICACLLAYHSLMEKKWIPFLVFIASFIGLLLLYILPLLPYGFGYWFNHGQAPHSSRVSAFDIADEFFGSSPWIKFYLFIIFLLLAISYKKWKSLFANRRVMMLLLLTLAMLGEAAVFQVTSYTPPDNNIFFHSFAITFIFSMLSFLLPTEFDKPGIVFLSAAGVLLWWSASYWKYTQRIVAFMVPDKKEKKLAGEENIVNRKTYMLNDDTLDAPMNKWVECGLKSFDRIYMPQGTADGIHRILNMDIVKQKKPIKVLNMSELTPLAVEIPYALEKNPQLPLWYHLGVGMFNQQAAIFEKRILQHEYDLVLFEYVPRLNNFYPFRTRDSLRVYYRLVDAFTAPRRGETNGTIEVYIKP
ncbi:MAG TPA: hypothetical protein VK543_11060 [Puia sp.]|nr:hypothetical protein [Puia sp.]